MVLLVGGVVLGAPVIIPLRTVSSQLIDGLVITVPLGEVAVKARDYWPVVAVIFIVLAVACGLAATTTASLTTANFIMRNVDMGIGIYCSLPNCMDLAMRFLDAELRGGGSAVVQSMRQPGGSFGVAVSGTALTSTYRGHLPLDCGLPGELIEGATNSPLCGGVVAPGSGHSFLIFSIRSRTDLSRESSTFLGECVLVGLVVVVDAISVSRGFGSGSEEFADE